MAEVSCSMCCGTGKFNDFDIDPITKAVTDVIINCPSCMGTGKRGGSQTNTSSGNNNQSGSNAIGGQIPK